MSVVHCFFSHERAMDQEWRLKPFKWCNFMIESAQRILLESKAFFSSWNHLNIFRTTTHQNRCAMLSNRSWIYDFCVPDVWSIYGPFQCLRPTENYRKNSCNDTRKFRDIFLIGSILIIIFGKCKSVRPCLKLVSTKSDNTIITQTNLIFLALSLKI